MNRAALLDEVARLAERAGERILAIYQAGFAVERKADASPVTAADREAEALILEGLAGLTPDIPVVSEEAAAAGHAPAVAERFWLVDPLDGTKEFAARVGEFTVNIGLIEAGVPTLGVVYLPVSGDTYMAAGPGTAQRRTKAGAARSIAARAPAPDGLVVLTSRFHADETRLNALLARYTVKARRIAGSALKFCLIAAGEADLYPRFGPTMEWDTAAGHAIVGAAGGAVETLDGAPLRYRKPGFLNSDFIVRGR